ncbi:MAG: Formiminotransferase-cyclodeaminase [Clostridia bacterium]|jgi:formiminotetrahydrofolate cyclodeaminase|nr:Formiminotransferase-cyclodeaminase [Clostridia bacterium]
MGLLMEMTLEKYSDVLASNEPAPGGGSTAALSGLMGASLTMMVVNLSVGKKSYEALDEAVKQKFMEDFHRVEGLKKDLVHLVDEDTAAFNKFMEAMKLPKDTEEQKKIREEKMQQASIYALEIPLKTAEKCLGILQNQETIASYGNKNAVSDVGVGALMALSGLEGAVLNVKINIPGINDESIKNEASAKYEKLLADGVRLQKNIMEIVNKRIG